MADDSNVVSIKKLTKPALHKFLDDYAKQKTNAKTEQGELGPMAKKFSEQYGIPNNVLTWLSKLDRMSETKKADYVAGLEQALPLMKDRLKMGDLFAGGSADTAAKKPPFAPGPKPDEAKKPAAGKAKETA